MLLTDQNNLMQKLSRSVVLPQEDIDAMTAPVVGQTSRLNAHVQDVEAPDAKLPPTDSVAGDQA
jgi:hypothetical protein